MGRPVARSRQFRVVVLALFVASGCANPDRPRRPPVVNPGSSEAERRQACDRYWAYTLSFPDLLSGPCPR